MAEISVLIAELSTDPLGRGYAAMSDEEAADDLNLAYRPGSRIATVQDVQAYLITQINGTGVNQRSVMGLIQEFAELGTVRGVAPTVSPVNSLDARRSACQMIWYMLRYGMPESGFPVDDTNIQAQFVAIGPDGGNGPSVLDANQLTAIAALGTRLLSRSEELGQGMVEARDIRWAREEIA